MRSLDPAALRAETAACLERYQSSHDVRELDRGVRLCREAESHPIALGNLATMLLVRFEERGVRSDLDEAQSALAALAPSGLTTQQGSMLARMAVYNYELDEDQAELQRAIRLVRYLLANALPQDIALPGLNAVLGNALTYRFELTAQVADLDQALCAYHAAADSDTGFRRLVHLANFVRQSRRRIELAAPPLATGLAAATIAAAEEVATHFPGDQAVRGEMWQAAGVLLRYRYEATGDPADLYGSARRLRQAVLLPTATPEDHTNRLVSLSTALVYEFMATGNRDALTEAIEGNRQALAATPPEHQERPGRLNNLAAALRQRALYFNDVDALAETVELLREAVAITPDQQGRAVVLNTLGVSLQDVFTLTRDADAADEAVIRAHEAIRLGGDDHDHLWLTLANAYAQKYLARGDSADLAEALRLLRDLLDRLPTGSPLRNRCLAALGHDWQLEFERTGDLQALDRAIAALGRAMRADPLTDSQRAEYRRWFAELLLVQHDRVRAIGPLRSATEAFAAAAADSADDPLARVLSASRWADAAARIDDWSRALQAAKMAMSLLPEVVSRRLMRTDREHGIAQLAGVAADAAACALQAADADLAVRWLEQGRGVLLGQTLDARSAVSELRSRHPGTAARFAELDAALADLDIAPMGSDRRHEVARQREVLLDDIRELPGFAEFLLPPTLAQVHEWAGPGPVVLVNVSRFRCDALVLAAGTLVAIPLPELTFTDAARNADRFAEAIDASNEPGREHDSGQVISEILNWLDDTVTGPVLARLPCDGARVWWSPGGPLTALPLHAAGRPGNSVLDRVISSYTPTVRALGNARSAAAKPGRSRAMMTVAVPEPDTAPPLPHAYQEADAVGELWSATAFTGADATPDRVLDALARHGYAHFACHGVHDPAEPSASSLLLHGRPLTMLEMSRAHLPDARLAVLSACHTARGAPRLADEALHLAGAFQLAGFPSVVATLWQVNDRIASRIALAFHTRLAATGMPPAPDRAAAVLHEVLHQFRDYPPSIWAGWVHSGA
ncbi:CHAT domain-containing protein [Saccharopolyspora cebuensis]|uniref:CHAT domain-containing protein n=1 Tax=Saccharopolyspora cebuensis TaxID=418759 RepID=UPI0031E98A8F